MSHKDQVHKDELEYQVKESLLVKPSILSFAFGAALLLTSMAAAADRRSGQHRGPGGAIVSCCGSDGDSGPQGTWVGKGEAIVDGPAGIIRRA